MIKKGLVFTFMLGFSLSLLFITLSTSDLAFAKNYKGCYTCRGGSYVKFRGSDTFDNRKKAKALGCDISGTTSSCDAANNKVLGTVG